MTTIKARCPACDEVEMPSVDVWLKVCRNVPSLSQFGFRCPACHQQLAKDADNRVISLLLSAGVKGESWSVPLEVFEPHQGPAISCDDVLDLHQALESADVWAELG